MGHRVIARRRRSRRSPAFRQWATGSRRTVMAAARAAGFRRHRGGVDRRCRRQARHRQQRGAARRRTRRPRRSPRRCARATGLGGNAGCGRACRNPPAGAGAGLDGAGISTEVSMPALLSSTRRDFLIGSGTLFAWAHTPRLARAEGRDPRVLVVVLRGARALVLDGKPPALPLDSFFALNPAMPNLHRLYQAQQATIVHASATPYRDRSHFAGQDVLESGFSKPGSYDSGWLNRALSR